MCTGKKYVERLEAETNGKLTIHESRPGDYYLLGTGYK